MNFYLGKTESGEFALSAGDPNDDFKVKVRVFVTDLYGAASKPREITVEVYYDLKSMRYNLSTVTTHTLRNIQPKLFKQNFENNVYINSQVTESEDILDTKKILQMLQDPGLSDPAKLGNIAGNLFDTMDKSIVDTKKVKWFLL